MVELALIDRVPAARPGAEKAVGSLGCVARRCSPALCPGEGTSGALGGTQTHCMLSCSEDPAGGGVLCRLRTSVTEWLLLPWRSASVFVCWAGNEHSPAVCWAAQQTSTAPPAQQEPGRELGAPMLLVGCLSTTAGLAGQHPPELLLAIPPEFCFLLPRRMQDPGPSTTSGDPTAPPRSTSGRTAHTGMAAVCSTALPALLSHQETKAVHSQALRCSVTHTAGPNLVLQS